jgi:hypothetical protein
LKRWIRFEIATAAAVAVNSEEFVRGSLDMGILPEKNNH